MREIDPFDYWEGHSSAIEGLGGDSRSPDPRYCFHTRYHEIRPGRADFVLRLIGVSATFGELSMRVHAWKPETNSDINLVAGSRLVLNTNTGADVVHAVHFSAQRGVLYALYGFLSEDSDVAARQLEIAINELHESAERPDPPKSVLATVYTSETSNPDSVYYYGKLTVNSPVSQVCTFDQLAELELTEEGGAAIFAWSERLSLNALHAYGIMQRGIEGLLVEPFSKALADSVARQATVSRQCLALTPARNGDDFFDFLLMPDAFADVTSAATRWQSLADWLDRLKIGGMAIFGIRYLAENELTSSSVAVDSHRLSRNEINQWALRLMGGSYSVAPLAFGQTEKLVLDSDGCAGMILIVQRS